MKKVKREPTGRELANEGIKRAVDHADRQGKKWSLEIIRYLKKWLSMQRHGRVFAVEDFKRWIELKHPEMVPPSHNAWGYVGRVLRELGLAVLVGERPANNPKTRSHPVKTFRRKK